MGTPGMSGMIGAGSLGDKSGALSQRSLYKPNVSHNYNPLYTINNSINESLKLSYNNFPAS